MKARIPQALAPAILRATAERLTRTCRPRGRLRPRFELDERAAREFLARALRREAGDAPTPVSGESWTLAPGWDLSTIYSDETGHVENLVYQAVWEAGVIICPAGAGIALIVEARPGEDWMYQWRVSFPAGLFAICNAYRDEFRRLGHHEEGIRAQGCATAMAVLREAVDYGNQLLAAYASARGRIVTRRPPRYLGH